MMVHVGIRLSAGLAQVYSNWSLSRSLVDELAVHDNLDVSVPDERVARASDGRESVCQMVWASFPCQ
jgi:hypothetical protein